MDSGLPPRSLPKSDAIGDPDTPPAPDKMTPMYE